MNITRFVPRCDPGPQISRAADFPLGTAEHPSPLSFSHTHSRLRASQWSPSHNQNSDSHVVQPGDELYGSITYDAQKNLYNVYHNSSDGWEVTMP
jgi:hypothetical protein